MMSLQMRKTFQDQITTWASWAMMFMTVCQKIKEGPQFENTFKRKDSNEYFPNVEILSRLMNEQYNQLKEKFPSLTIERHQVLFQPKTEQKPFLLSTNILTPLYHFSDKKRTLPLRCEEFCWELFLKGDSGFVKKNLSDTINQNPTPAEKELISAIC